MVQRPSKWVCSFILELVIVCARFPKDKQTECGLPRGFRMETPVAIEMSQAGSGSASELNRVGEGRI